MSFAVDVNLLLYASDATHPAHPKAAAFLDRCVSAREVFCMAWPTLMSYLRMATHSALFTRPLTPDEAARNVEALIGLPHVRVISEEEGFWPIYRVVAASVAARGNLVPDVHLAALLRQHGPARSTRTTAISGASISSTCAIRSNPTPEIDLRGNDQQR